MCSLCCAIVISVFRLMTDGAAAVIVAIAASSVTDVCDACCVVAVLLVCVNC